MKVIKYKIWDKHKKRFLHGFDVDDSFWFVFKKHEPVCELMMNKDSYEIVMCTDLKDKNGKEIYEGDIVEVTESSPIVRGVVVFKYGCFWVQKDDSDPYFLVDLVDFIKVIGNIYEHKHLLEESKNDKKMANN
jgi:uncharacterized phage protein (TIGR01671 family)